MKIAKSGIDLEEGKIKYEDPVFSGLVEKFDPAKQAPYYFELMHEDYTAANAIAITKDNILDLLILDMEKLENRINRAEDDAETAVLKRCLEILENEQPVCDLEIDENERAILTTISPLSFKPTVILEDASMDANTVCKQVMEKAGMMFFYTAGKQEVHAWIVEKGTDAVTCAGRIHSDLARGFIKAELISVDDLMAAHSFADASSKGLTNLVDKDFIVPENTILEIRFNV
jgi:ribosome-binding ATPase YchF (GTP1/OBG family)